MGEEGGGVLVDAAVENTTVPRERPPVVGCVDHFCVSTVSLRDRLLENRHNLLKYNKKWRKGWDSNPRAPIKGQPDFEAHL